MSPPDTNWLVDKSAFNRLAASPDAPEWINRANRGLIKISTVTRLEVGYSARSATDLRGALTSAPRRSMPVEYMTPTI